MDPLDGPFRGLDTAMSGLRAQLRRSEVAARNLANMQTTKTETGEPYRRRMLVFEEVLEDAMSAGGAAGGVRVAAELEDTTTPFTVVHDPGHPHADAEGFVKLPNVDLFRELVELSVAERSYQSNLSALRTYRGMLEDTLANFR